MRFVRWALKKRPHYAQNIGLEIAPVSCLTRSPWRMDKIMDIPSAARTRRNAGRELWQKTNAAASLKRPFRTCTGSLCFYTQFYETAALLAQHLTSCPYTQLVLFQSAQAPRLIPPLCLCWKTVNTSHMLSDRVRRRNCVRRRIRSRIIQFFDGLGKSVSHLGNGTAIGFRWHCHVLSSIGFLWVFDVLSRQSRTIDQLRIFTSCGEKDNTLYSTTVVRLYIFRGLRVGIREPEIDACSACIYWQCNKFVQYEYSCNDKTSTESRLPYPIL